MGDVLSKESPYSPDIKDTEDPKPEELKKTIEELLVKEAKVDEQLKAIEQEQNKLKDICADLERVKTKLRRSELDCRDNRKDNQFLHNQVRSLKRRLDVVERNEEALYKRERQAREEREKRRRVETEIKERVRLEEKERDKIRSELLQDK